MYFLKRLFNVHILLIRSTHRAHMFVQFSTVFITPASMSAKSAVSTLRSLREFNEGNTTVVFTGKVVSLDEVVA